MSEDWPLKLKQLTYYSAVLGWSPFPARDKRPLEKGWQTKDYKLEEFKGHPQVGIRTGKVSDMLVLDIDSQEGVDYVKEKQRDEKIKAPMVQSPSRFYHIYYKYHPALKGSVGFQPGLDIRTDGNLIIAPPSPNYKWLTPPTLPLPPVPDWLVKEFTESTKSVKSRGKVYTDMELLNELNSVTLEGEGRDKELVRVGGCLGNAQRVPFYLGLKFLNAYDKIHNSPPLGEAMVLKKWESILNMEDKKLPKGDD